MIKVFSIAITEIATNRVKVLVAKNVDELTKMTKKYLMSEAMYNDFDEKLRQEINSSKSISFFMLVFRGIYRFNELEVHYL